jgi:hypothetical protein
VKKSQTLKPKKKKEAEKSTDLSKTLSGSSNDSTLSSSLDYSKTMPRGKDLN